MAPINLQPTLEGELLTLRPLRAEDFDALYAAASDPLIWAQHPRHDRWQREVFTEYFRGAIESRSAFIVIDRASGRVIGCTRYHGHDPVRREVEIGWTFLVRECWGGRFNGEMKRLMLTHAFGFVDRVNLLVGPNNVRSRKAVERIGGIYAGMRPDDEGIDHLVFQVEAPRGDSPAKPIRSPE
ncbi:MAG: GNAT family N-acetyltransferase [Phycisphaeraceae bacterium]|nr:GNAT family N-acetyltransferase [Phycisphaeraceae bacterium]